ncbi:hypothetical protein ICW40_20495, partial [Actinotalea ferrariae]|uniref:glycosyltransferase family 2 protein n=1 Tax=Actinotalea ferrariae TaxID=1386098 RepID=UPI001EB3730E|nr:hypothetical protein [Actinotalea ferrariae]
MSQAHPQASASTVRPRTAEVTAVLVTRGVTEYVEESLTALLAQTRPPQRVLVVDAAPEAHGDAHPDEDLRALLARVQAAAPAGGGAGSGTGEPPTPSATPHA